MTRFWCFPRVAPIDGESSDREDDTVGKKPLDWKTRMKIAKGVAKALQYLHDQKDPPVLFGDLKASSILLDENFNPKLFDFSFAKLGPTWDNSKGSRMVIGKVGYCAPEYGSTGILTKQYDIFSFGVVLLELISGRKAIQENLVKNRSIVYWTRPYISDSMKFKEIVDPSMEGCYPENELAQALAVAEMCVQEDAKKRPPIADVVAKLPRVQADGEALG
ncbi:probable serine/threonine-protein kinase PBL7 [Papaver somniferum]|uniref:probable serine/threonine-protein kinase PBL7 n=1 Tax=Papaver somniferum TaxID=3469 RepID=UPI000E6FE4EB|nr:probable serine/threonine-protein kinase PBL7 [Papaver somniferum]